MADTVKQYTEREEIKQRTAMPLLWISMVGMGMAFAGLSSAYIIRQADTDWLTFDMPQPFYISALIIIASHGTMIPAQKAVKKNQLITVKNMVAASLVLGLLFVGSQFYAYSYMVEHGLHLVGTSISSSFMYVLTGFHLVHLFAGLIVLSVTLFQTSRNKYNAENHLGLSLAATFWHFLGVLWIYLVLFLAFIR